MSSTLVLIGGNKQIPSGWVLHKQTADLDAPPFHIAERDCANWAWVAGIVDMASAAGVHLQQEYMVDRLYGGSRCSENVGDFEQLAKDISHDYVLEDGQKFRIEANFRSTLPPDPEPLILAVRQHTPVMLLWRSRPLLLTGISYDEYIAPSGNKLFVVSELRLFDPAASTSEHGVTFARDRDDVAELNGMLQLSVYRK